MSAAMLPLILSKLTSPEDIFFRFPLAYSMLTTYKLKFNLKCV